MIVRLAHLLPLALIGACSVDATGDPDAATGPPDTAVADSIHADTATSGDADSVDAGDSHAGDTAQPVDSAADIADTAVTDTVLTDSATGDTTPSDTVPTDTTAPAWSWPWPPETVAIAPHATWKETVTFPYDDFLSPYSSGGVPRWVKFTVFTGDPSRIVFQDGRAYAFHYAFAAERLARFAGMDRAAFDAATLVHPGKVAILGAVLIPTGGDQIREAAFQIVGEDAYHPEEVAVIQELVRSALVPLQGHVTPELFYFPTYAQTASVAAQAGAYEAKGIAVSDASRWAGGDICYVPGWAVGRLVSVPPDEIDAAYLDGRLGPGDILLTDQAPAEVPLVAGILTRRPSTPNSHVAILAATYGVPFAYLATDEGLAAAEGLVGSEVVLRTGSPASYTGILGSCSVAVVAGSGLTERHRSDLLALRAPPEILYPAKRSRGAVSVAAETLTPADTATVGGKAAQFGVLRRALPDNSPSPALALPFDVWDAVMGATVPSLNKALGTEIADRLAGLSWPPDLAGVAYQLAGIRALIRDEAVFPEATRSAVLAALSDAGFAETEKIRFRSSTNVEDTAHFTGAGLYDSYSGCLADALDGDEVGPSACDASAAKERGVFRAIRKVFASFYNDGAFLARLRGGVDESTAAMGVLVHPSFPDAFERANGVVTYDNINGNHREATLVSQVGAVSVTNPVGGATPEVVTVYDYSFSTSASLRQPTSLLPLGDHVLAWDAEYLRLFGLTKTVAQAWGSALPPAQHFLLDFEYKLVAREGLRDVLVLKQVRPLPVPDRVTKQSTFLIPGASGADLCTFQGEYASVWDNHRLKVRLSFAHMGAWLGPDAPESPVLTHLDWRRAAAGGSVQTVGDPRTWEGFGFLATGDAYQQTMAHTWRDASLAAAVDLSWGHPFEVAANEPPVLILDADGVLTLGASYDVPTFIYNLYSGRDTQAEDRVRLGPCPQDMAVGSVVTRTTAVGPVTITTRYGYPPPPAGVVAGYTAELAGFEQTTIAGLTTTPIVLTSYWSQSFRPGHHNFSEDFVFEPRLEPGIDAAQLAELEEAGVRFIFMTLGYGGEDGRIAVSSDGARFTELTVRE